MTAELADDVRRAAGSALDAADPTAVADVTARPTDPQRATDETPEPSL